MDAAVADRRRDIKVSSLIGVVHFSSHFYQLSLPALFPLIHARDGISYVMLGALSTIFFFTSGVLQTPAGFLVDRIGGRRVLIGGMILLASSIALFGLVSEYWMMMALSVAAGIGNSVFHPADYSVLTASISDSRIGRAYSVHGLGGFAGYGAAPVAMLALAAWLGWREAMLAVGLVGLIIALVIYTQRADISSGGTDDAAESGTATETAQSGIGEGIRLLIQPATILCFLFFALTAMGQVGNMTMGPAALIAFVEAPLAVANGAVTAMLAGVIVGVFLGGMLADRHDRHDLVTGGFLTVAAAIIALVPIIEPRGVWILVIFLSAGLFYGVTGPARDMVVRSIAPRDSRGKVFGFTYSGLDFGSAASAVLFGALVDAGEARWVFVLISVVMVLGVASILLSRFFARRA
jgi:MFS family permease